MLEKVPLRLLQLFFVMQTYISVGNVRKSNVNDLEREKLNEGTAEDDVLAHFSHSSSVCRLV